MFGIVVADGRSPAIAMELVDGRSLDELRGPVPIREVLPIARQIAAALQAAHDSGIIHRDLKPANIKIRDDGTVKVLDFGLAKAIDPAAASHDPSTSPTITSPATGLGVILGTAAYMSPEQARGSIVDRRADIWAFGVVVFELLTGTRLSRETRCPTRLRPSCVRKSRGIVCRLPFRRSSGDCSASASYATSAIA